MAMARSYSTDVLHTQMENHTPRPLSYLTPTVHSWVYIRWSYSVLPCLNWILVDHPFCQLAHTH